MPVVVSTLSCRRSVTSFGLFVGTVTAIVCGCWTPLFAMQASGENAPAGNAAVTAPAAPDGSTGFNLEAYQKAVLEERSRTRQLMAINEPLLGKDAEAEFIKISRAYRQLLVAGPNLSSAGDRRIVQQGLEYRILRAADPGIQQSPHMMANVLTDVRRDLSSAGTQINNPQSKQRFREEVMTEALVHLKKLLTNNLDSRVFALTVMVDLEVVQSGFGQKRILILDAVPATFRQVLADATQPDTVRAVATIQIGRYLRKTEALPVEQMDLARAMATELARWDTEDSYQLALLDSLAAVQQPREIVGRPVPTVLNAFLSVISDKNRWIHVRCRAAAGVGLAGYDAQINFDPIAWKVVQLSIEAAQNFNKAPQNPAYQRCGFDLYVAFHPASSGADGTGKGMLNRAPRSEAVKNAYEQCLKIAGPMIFTQRAISDAVVTEVNAWVNANVPSNLNYDGSGTGSVIKP